MAINIFLSTYYAIKLSVCCLLLCTNLQCHTVKDLALPNYTTVLFGGGAEQPVFWQIAALVGSPFKLLQFYYMFAYKALAIYLTSV